MATLKLLFVVVAIAGLHDCGYEDEQADHAYYCDQVAKEVWRPYRDEPCEE